MSSTPYAEAHHRVLIRQQQRDAALQAEAQTRRQQHLSTRVGQLPFPLGNLGRGGLEVWQSIKGREGTGPAFRVGQLDSELLDEELLELLKAQAGEGLKYFGSHLSQEWSVEILLVLRAVLFKLSLWDHDASYGAALQGLRYKDARDKTSIIKPPARWQKALYGLFTVGGRYGWNKWEDYLIDQEGGFEGPSHRVSILSRLSSTLSTTHGIASFLSFLVFLVNGRYRTLLDRILRLRLVPPTSQVSREVSFEYLNRQLVWHAFTEFLLFLLPLVGISRWRRWLTRAWRKAKALARNEDTEEDVSESGELSFLPERTCAICYQDQNPTTTSENEILAVTSASGGITGSAQTDITNPYETIPCHCIYCFVCLATRLDAEEGEGFVCLRCGTLVKQCKPWAGDVLEEDPPRPRSSKSVSFSDEDEIMEAEAEDSQTEMKEVDDSGYYTASGTDHHDEKS